METETKQRQHQAADTCKQHLREQYPDKLSLVEEFISEFEGTGRNEDITKWSRFNDESWIELEMLNRLEEHFEKWLNLLA